MAQHDNGTTVPDWQQSRFDKFESIVEAEFTNLSGPDAQLNDLLIREFTDGIRSEVDEIRNGMLEVMLSLESDYLKGKFIREQQRMIMLLTGNLLRNSTPEDLFKKYRTANRHVILRYMYESLQGLLEFVEQNFGVYMNMHGSVPANYRRLVCEELKGSQAFITAELKTGKVDRELIRLIIEPFRSFQDGASPEDYAYERIGWLRSLSRQWTGGKSGASADDVLSMLVSLNFNSPDYFTYITKQLSIRLDETEPSRVRIEKLAWMQKIVKQAELRHGFSYRADFPPLRDQLIAWIGHEMEFQRTVNELTGLTEARENDTGYKVKVNISVGQFAYLIRIMKETGIIQNQNVTLLIRFLSQHVKTEHSEDISNESLRNRYHKPRGRVREEMKNILLRLLNHIHVSRP